MFTLQAREAFRDLSLVLLYPQHLALETPKVVVGLKGYALWIHSRSSFIPSNAGSRNEIQPFPQAHPFRQAPEEPQHRQLRRFLTVVIACNRDLVDRRGIQEQDKIPQSASGWPGLYSMGFKGRMDGAKGGVSGIREFEWRSRLITSAHSMSNGSVIYNSW